jgi:hypothetical protein
MILSKPSYDSLASWTLTALTRSAVAVGLPIYLLSCIYVPQKIPKTPLLTASLVILSSPSTLLCALGAIEGFVRSCGKMASYCSHMQTQQAHYRWHQFLREATTTHGLIRGTLSPISGYTIIVNEWSKQGPFSKVGSPRQLKEEYLVYRTLRAFGRAIVDALFWTYNQIVWCLQKIQAGIIALWNGACFVVNKVIEAVNFAWRVTQPLRDLAIKGLTKCLNAFKWVIWDLAVKIVLIEWIFKKVIWDIGIKIIFLKIIWPPIKFLFQKILWPMQDFAIKGLTKCLNACKWVIWDFAVKTVLKDWILKKVIWNIGMKIIFLKIVWPPVKFLLQKILWPLLKFGMHTISAIVNTALNLITWTTRQIYKGGN